jgi:hypothetical protein
MGSEDFSGVVAEDVRDENGTFTVSLFLSQRSNLYVSTKSLLVRAGLLCTVGKETSNKAKVVLLLKLIRIHSSLAF